MFVFPRGYLCSSFNEGLDHGLELVAVNFQIGTATRWYIGGILSVSHTLANGIRLKIVHKQIRFSDGLIHGETSFQ